MATDQEIRDEGYKFIPPQYYLQSSFVLPQTEEDDQVTESVGIPYTHAFTHSTGDGPGQVPLGLTYDPNAVAATQAASVNTPFQTYTSSLSAPRGPEIVMENLQKFEDQDLIDKAREYNPGKYDKFTDREMFDLGIKVGNHPLDNPTYETSVIPGQTLASAFTADGSNTVKTLEDEDDKGWFSSLFSSTPKVKGTLGTRLKNRPKLPLPSSWFAWTRNPLNPFSPNYNPKFEHQLNYLEMQDNIGRDQASGLLKYGPNTVLRGQNVMSLFGSNDPEEQLQKYIDKMLTRETKAMAKGRQLTAFQQKQLQKARDELSGIKEGGGGNVEHTPTSSKSTYSAEERGSGGEAKDWGKTETRESSGWESSPFEKGGLVNFFKYGGLAGIL